MYGGGMSGYVNDLVVYKLDDPLRVRRDTQISVDVIIIEQPPCETPAA